MRRAEIITAGILAVISIYLMWKSAELPIWLHQRRGPRRRLLAVLAVGHHVWAAPS